MKLEKAIENLNKILEEWRKILNIEDEIEREIETNLYMEEMPFKEIEVVLNELERLQEDNHEWEIIFDVFNEREYRKKYLEEERAKRPKLLYPDADEIYKKYYKLKTENSNITREILSRTNVLNELLKENETLNKKIAEIRDKAECKDYYGLCDVIDDLNKLLGDE